jgi:hypothetical protein
MCGVLGFNYLIDVLVQGKNESVASVFSFLIILVKVAFKILLAVPDEAGIVC